MKRINISKDIYPLSEFRANAAALIDQVRKTKRPMVLTQNGKSSAVVLDVDEYESLLDKLELLQEVELAENQLQAGMRIQHDEAQKIIKKRYQKNK
jgi:prevent-host-death family protein